MQDQNQNTGDLEETIAMLRDVHRYDGYKFYRKNKAYCVENGILIRPGKEPTPITYIGGITSQRHHSRRDNIGLDPIVYAILEGAPDNFPIPLLLGEPVEPHEGGYLVVGFEGKQCIVRHIERIEKPD